LRAKPTLSLALPTDGRAPLFRGAEAKVAHPPQFGNATSVVPGGPALPASRIRFARGLGGLHMPVMKP